MTTGTIDSYDPEEESGYILIDGTDDRIPFDTSAVDDFKEGDMLHEGQRVQLAVEGGPAGVYAARIKRLSA